MKNLGGIERVVRLILGLLLIEAGYFWLGGGAQMLAIAAGLLLLATALLGFCPVHKLLKINTLRTGAPPPRPWVGAALAVLVALILAGGSYASHFLSKKIYLEDFNRMNHYYKQALFHTGQQDREQAIANYDELVQQYGAFATKYSRYHPYALKRDPQFNADLARVSGLIAGVQEPVHGGDLAQAHRELEQIRPVFQEIFKRNGFSLLAVALVDFHDVMELVLDAANAKDPGHVAVAYADADSKLKAVEAEAQDAEIRAIRDHLETVRRLAEAGELEQLPAAANALKSSFVKVYLKRG